MSNEPTPPELISSEKQIEPVNYQENTQINLNILDNELHLPTADELNSHTPEVRTAIIEAFRKEQDHRHEFMRKQQEFDNLLNQKIVEGNREKYKLEDLQKTRGAYLGTTIVLALILLVVCPANR